jgi:hypothetical protein
MNLKKLALNGLLALSIYQTEMVTCEAKIFDVVDDLFLPIQTEQVAVRDSFQNPDWELVTVKDSPTVIVNLAIVTSDNVKGSDVASRGLNPVALPIQSEKVAVSDSKVVAWGTTNPFTISKVDSVATSDSKTAVLGLIISGVDSIAVSDVLGPRISPLIISSVDSVQCSELATLAPTIGLQGTESIAISEVATTLFNPLVRSVLDSVATSDSYSLYINPLSISISDRVAIVDTKDEVITPRYDQSSRSSGDPVNLLWTAKSL